MRGSQKWQVIQLVKIVFEQRISKDDRRNITSDKYNMVTQNTTMQTYKVIWIEIARYVKKKFSVNDIELLTNLHIEKYLHHKVNSGIARQTLEKLSSAIGKLEFALTLYSMNKGKNSSYDFNSRIKVLQYAKEFSLIYDGYHNRAYIDAKNIIKNLKGSDYQLAAKLQYEGGARIGGIEYLKSEVSIGYQKLVDNHLVGSVKINSKLKDKAFVSTLQGIINDPALLQMNVKKEVGQILTIEKGGKPGLIYVSTETYHQLEALLSKKNIFQINRFAYMKQLNLTCKKLGYSSEGSHGFRWSHVQNRQEELVSSGYTIDESLLINSVEHKHWRKEITNHYLT